MEPLRPVYSLDHGGTVGSTFLLSGRLSYLALLNTGMSHFEKTSHKVPPPFFIEGPVLSYNPNGTYGGTSFKSYPWWDWLPNLKSCKLKNRQVHPIPALIKANGCCLK